MAAKLLAAEELIKKLQAELANALKSAEHVSSTQIYSGSGRAAIHVARRGCPECEGDSDYEEECECS